MKAVVINYTGTVDKTTIAANLLSPANDGFVGAQRLLLADCSLSLFAATGQGSVKTFESQ